MTPDPVGGPAARTAARTELQRREYHQDDPGPLTRALHWIGDRLNSLFSSDGGSHAILLLLLVVVILVVVFAVRPGRPRRAFRDSDAGGVDPLAPVPLQDHRGLAARYSAEGRRPEALREWLRAAVASIEERGILTPQPGRTGAATARQAGPLLPAAATDLAAATTAFDEVWFGGRAATDADVARARSAADLAASARIVATGAAPERLQVPW